MKYCPNCGSEYLDETDICSDCNIRLTGENEYLKRKDAEDAELKELDRLSRVCVLENRFEGDVIRDALEKEGITFIIREFRDTAYDGLFITQLGWGEVMVSDEEVKRAEETIDNIRKDIAKENKY
ncbi:MAG: hypothetical protein HY739_15290 [Desulfobacterales bacterium]|nr:hypothetical protein [Desulfobacterales bacterium]